MENSALNKLADQELKINLAALRKCDEFVLDILETSSQVALYKFGPVKQVWEKTEVEGSLFLYRRSTLPKFALLIMNRLNRKNLNEYISKDMEFKVQKPFLLYKNASMDILGIWFNNPDKCQKLGELITGLYASPKPEEAKAETRNSERNILEMFANAQRKYDGNKTSENGPLHSSTQPQGIRTSGGKIRSKSLSTDTSTQASPSLLLPAAVENEEAQSHALHDPCIVRSSPLRPSPAGILSRSLPNSAKKTPQRQLFTQELAPSSIASQLPNEKVPFPSFPTQSVSPAKAVNSKPGMISQRSGSDISLAASLMSPLAFKSTKSQSRLPKDVPEIPTLTKEQLQETLVYLLEKDSDFLEKIHTTYLKNAGC